MSEIEFVNRLGDAFDSTLAKSTAGGRGRARGRRRILIAAVIGGLLLAAGLAAAQILSDNATELAANGVGCYDQPKLSANVAVLSPRSGQSPAQACATVYRQQGRDVPSWVACAGPHAVLVFPGRDPGLCQRLGLAVLPTAYGAGRDRVASLDRAVRSLEARSGCIEPRQLAVEVQALLARLRWTGWRPWLRLDLGGGPCGAVTGPQTGGRPRTILLMDFTNRRIAVFGTPHRSRPR
jgi:hypothetical protein